MEHFDRYDLLNNKDGDLIEIRVNGEPQGVYQYDLDTESYIKLDDLLKKVMESNGSVKDRIYVTLSEAIAELRYEVGILKAVVLSKQLE